MKAPVDETTLVSITKSDPPTPSDMQLAAAALDQFLSTAVSTLGTSLGLGRPLHCMIQGSAYCGALAYDETGSTTKALISPEELTAAMAVKFLQEADYE